MCFGVLRRFRIMIPPTLRHLYQFYSVCIRTLHTSIPNLLPLRIVYGTGGKLLE